MAKDDPQTLCDRLFGSFLAPLVVGGTMTPGKPFGGKRALAFGEGRAPTDVDLVSRTELLRVRSARRLVPIDTLEPAPKGAEWALAATLHDLVQATHPGFDAVFRRSGPRRILDVVEKTLDRIAPPGSVGDSLSRHTWFSRMFEVTRVDVDLRWWTGSERFLGTAPPKRLRAWPELRRLTETRAARSLMDLPANGAAVDAARFAGLVSRFLQRTPLTDLATLNRSTPAFSWTHESLALVSTRAGRTIVGRALAFLPQREVDAALGRATRRLFERKAVRALGVAIELLRDRVLLLASARLGAIDPAPLSAGVEADDAAFALGAGALAATSWIERTGGGFAEDERRAMLLVLGPIARSTAAGKARALLG